MSVDLVDIASARGFLQEMLDLEQIKDPANEKDSTRHLWAMITFLREFWSAGYTTPFGIGRTQRVCRIGDTRFEPGDWVLTIEGAEGWEGLSFYAFASKLPYLGTFSLDYANIELRFPHEEAIERLLHLNDVPVTEHTELEKTAVLPPPDKRKN